MAAAAAGGAAAGAEALPGAGAASSSSSAGSGCTPSRSVRPRSEALDLLKLLYRRSVGSDRSLNIRGENFTGGRLSVFWVVEVDDDDKVVDSELPLGSSARFSLIPPVVAVPVSVDS